MCMFKTMQNDGSLDSIQQFDSKFIQTIITVFTVEKPEFNCIQK
jgi:hypothetical protein